MASLPGPAIGMRSGYWDPWTLLPASGPRGDAAQREHRTPAASIIGRAKVRRAGMGLPTHRLIGIDELVPIQHGIGFGIDEPPLVSIRL